MTIYKQGLDKIRYIPFKWVQSKSKIDLLQQKEPKWIALNWTEQQYVTKKIVLQLSIVTPAAGIHYNSFAV